MTRRSILVLIAVCGVAGATCAEDAEKPLWLAVCRPVFKKAMAPLAVRRRLDGFEAIVSTHSIKQSLAAAPRKPDFLLLVGDVEARNERADWYLASRSSELYRWRESQRADFASDMLWGDLDGDGIPDIPVGRIPARTVEQVRAVARKIVAYEEQAASESDLRLVGWCGAPGYSKAIDTLATSMLVGAVKTYAPPWVQPWLISADKSSPFCGRPADQPNLFSAQLQRGCLFGAMIGHGSTGCFHAMKDGMSYVEYTSRHVDRAFATGDPVSPVMILACDCGDFASSEQSLAESLLFADGGPVAVIAATTESHPLPNYYSAIHALKNLESGQRRVGSVWLQTQKDSAKAWNPIIERLLRDVEGKLEEKIDVKKLKRDQFLMYAILGDPATRLRIPDRLVAAARPTMKGWHWRVDRPEGAERISASFRSYGTPFPEAAEASSDARKAGKLLGAANASLSFTPLAGPAADAAWEGTVEGDGVLRLVVTGPKIFKIASLELKAEPQVD